MNRNDPSERVWNALKRLAQSESPNLTHGEAIKRVKAIARSQGALDLPPTVLDYYAREYRTMAMQRKKSG